MTGALQAGDVLGRVTLVTGSEEFLAERVVSSAQAAVRAYDAEAELAGATGDQLTLATLGELSAPSLFSTTRCVVVRRLEDLPEESHPGLCDYAASPAEDIALVLVHSGGAKGSGLLSRLRKLGSVTEHKTAALKPSELPGFVDAELRTHRVRIERAAAEVLIQAIGPDLRGLAAAAAQLANDLPDDVGGRPVSVDLVRRYFGGRAEAKTFDVAGHVLQGRTAQALEELRWALERGTAPVLMTAAMATSLRQLARFKAARGGREADLARDIGVPPWKLRDLRRQGQGWEPEGVARAIQVVARADADVKGQAHDAPYALERMVISVAGLRTRR